MALRVRRNQADLSSDERKRYTDAVRQMKSTGVYDRFVLIHQLSMAHTMVGSSMVMVNMWAHQRPGFPPWHRQLLMDFENALRDADATLHGGTPSTMTLPYWDWINYRTRKHFLWWGKIWRDDFMGPNGDSGKGNAVTSGPFRAPPPTSDGDFVPFYGPDQPGTPPLTLTDAGDAIPFLARQFGAQVDNLPTQQDWDDAKKITIYDSRNPTTLQWDDSIGANTTVPDFFGVPSFRNVFEGWVPHNPAIPQSELHNKVHVWVGGSMGPMSSPNDPVFFLHHCNVDRLWAEWQLSNPNLTYVQDSSTPELTGPDGHNLNDPMPPWDGVSRTITMPGGGTINLTLPVVRISDVLNHPSLGYRYDTDPPSLSVGP